MVAFFRKLLASAADAFDVMQGAKALGWTWAVVLTIGTGLSAAMGSVPWHWIIPTATFTAATTLYFIGRARQIAQAPVIGVSRNVSSQVQPTREPLFKNVQVLFGGAQQEIIFRATPVRSDDIVGVYVDWAALGDGAAMGRSYVMHPTKLHKKRSSVEPARRINKDHEIRMALGTIEKVGPPPTSTLRWAGGDQVQLRTSCVCRVVFLRQNDEEEVTPFMLMAQMAAGLADVPTIVTPDAYADICAWHRNETT
jgi:hypothetical protein